MKKYSPTHEWVEECGEEFLIGLSDYAQKELGDIVFVNLLDVGDPLICGESFADVESVKAVSEIYAPLSGIISAVNQEVLENAAVINEDAENTWLVKVKDVTQRMDLLEAEEYLASLK